MPWAQCGTRAELDRSRRCKRSSKREIVMLRRGAGRPPRQSAQPKREPAGGSSDRFCAFRMGARLAALAALAVRVASRSSAPSFESVDHPLSLRAWGLAAVISDPSTEISGLQRAPRNMRGVRRNSGGSFSRDARRPGTPQRRAVRLGGRLHRRPGTRRIACTASCPARDRRRTRGRFPTRRASDEVLCLDVAGLDAGDSLRSHHHVREMLAVDIVHAGLG